MRLPCLNEEAHLGHDSVQPQPSQKWPGRLPRASLYRCKKLKLFSSMSWPTYWHSLLFFMTVTHWETHWWETHFLIICYPAQKSTQKSRHTLAAKEKDLNWKIKTGLWCLRIGSITMWAVSSWSPRIKNSHMWVGLPWHSLIPQGGILR